MPHSTGMLNRSTCKWTNQCDEFLLPNSVDYCQQYLYAYISRLSNCRQRLVDAAARKWGEKKKALRLIDVEVGKQCVVLGTTFKQQEMKYSILKSLSDDLNVVPQPTGFTRLTCGDDVLFIEEEHQKCELVLAEEALMGQLVTGVPIVVLGQEKEDGRFYAEDCAFMTPAPSTFVSTTENHEEKVYVLLLSGLSFGAGEQEERSRRSAELLADWLTGRSHTPEKAARVARVLVAGNLISEKASDKTYSSKAKYLTRKTFSDSVDATRTVDEFLSGLTPNIHVDVMPGVQDMSNFILPQRPMHKCMFPRNRDSASLQTLTNPAQFSLNDVRFLGSSGQNVTDVLKHSTLPNSLDAMEALLRWGHVAPTCPDTLASYPFLDGDPFVIEELPRVFFSGNQETTEYRFAELEGKPLLISLASFAATGECVLVELNSLEAEVLAFDVCS